jgi:hypothetical protein
VRRHIRPSIPAIFPHSGLRADLSTENRQIAANRFKQTFHPTNIYDDSAGKVDLIG